MHFLELPLVIFTVLAQCAVGAYILITLRIAGFDNDEEKRQFAMKSLFVVLGFMAIGFAASTAHLGSPLRAFNSLNRVGASGLSNEILTGSLFFGVAGIYWLLEVLNKGGQGLRNALRIIGAVAGVIFMAAMIKVYLISTVPTWDNIYTPIEFALTSLTAGVLLGYLLLNAFSDVPAKANKGWAYLGSAIIVIHFIVIVLRILDFSTIATPLHSGVTELGKFSPMIITQCVLMLVAIVFWLIAAHKESGTCTAKMALVGFIAIFAAEIFGRGVFYGMHFTFGLL